MHENFLKGSLYLSFIIIIIMAPLLWCSSIHHHSEQINAFESITSGRSLLAIGDRYFSFIQLSLLVYCCCTFSILSFYVSSLTKGLVSGDIVHPYIFETHRQIYHHHNGRNISFVLHGTATIHQLIMKCPDVLRFKHLLLT